MAPVDSLTISGKYGAREDSLAIDPADRNGCLNKDNFQCTYFRPSKKSWVTECSSLKPDGNSIKSNLSNTSTDSEIESENVLRGGGEWSEELERYCTSIAVDGALNLSGKSIVSPRNVLDPVAFVGSNEKRNSCRKKRSLKGEKNSLPAKKKRLKSTKESKKNNSGKNKSLVSNAGNEHLKANVDNKLKKGPAKVINNRLVKYRGCKTTTEEMVQNNKHLRPVPGGGNISCKPERWNYLTRNLTNNEVISRRRNLMEDKIARNKRVLKAMKDVIQIINKNDQIPDETQENNSENGVENESENELENTENEQQESEQASREISTNQMPRTTQRQKPIFKNPIIERLLDKSMESAVKRYRTQINAWDKFKCRS